MKQQTRRLRGGMILLGFSLCLAWTGQSVLGQATPDTAKHEPQPKAMLVDGQPALSLDYSDGNGLLIVYTKWQDAPALRFSVEHTWDDNIHHSCGGFLWILRNEIAYTPGPSANQKCNAEQKRKVQAFDVEHAQITSLDLGQGNGFALDVGAKRFELTYFVHDDAPNQWVPANTDPAPASGKVAGYWFKLALDNFPTAEREFLKATHSTIPLTDRETATLTSAIQTAEVAERAGNLQAAFDTYVSASANLPPHASGKGVDSLRQHLFSLASKLNPPPAIPDEAQRYFFGSQAALQEWKDKGDTAKLDDAIEQLNEALRIAPWWPEAYFNRGVVLENMGRYADAVESYKLYLLAAPNASDATHTKQEIYMLEYKAREAETQK